MIWLTGSALGICILMIAGLVVVILVNGLSFFWPKPLEQVTLKDGSVFLGEVTNREAIPEPRPAGPPPEAPDPASRREPRPATASTSSGSTRTRSRSARRPADAYFVERREYGALLGVPVGGEGRRAHAGRRPGGRARGPPRAHREGGARPRARSRRSRSTRSAASTTASRRPAWSRAGWTSSRGASPAATCRGSGPRSRRPPPSSRRSSRPRPRSSRPSWRRRARPTSPSGPPRGAEGAALARHLPRLPGERARHGRAGSPSTAAACGSS